MRYKHTKKQLQEIIISSYSVAECLRKLNIKAAGGNYKTFKSKVLEWKLDTSHFRGQGWNVGLKFKPNPPKSLSEILTKESKYQTSKLKSRLLKENIKQYKCENCKLSTWLGRPIPLELHHIDGDSFNNELDNLQIICPNCHAFTDNYRARNMSAYKETCKVESVKFGESLTANTELSPEKEKCRDLTADT